MKQSVQTLAGTEDNIFFLHLETCTLTLKAKGVRTNADKNAVGGQKHC